MNDTPTLAERIAANPGVAKPGMTIAEVKQALIEAQGQNVDGRGLSPKQRTEVAAAGKRVWLDGVPMVREHVPVTTETEALDLAAAMECSGHYPAGLDACFAAGINGDAGPNGECIFYGTDTCTCDPAMWEWAR